MRGARAEPGDEGDPGRSALEEAVDEGQGFGVGPLQVVDEQVNARRAGERGQDADERVERPRATHPGAGSALAGERRKGRRREREVVRELRIGESIHENTRKGVHGGVEHVVLDVFPGARAAGEHQPPGLPRDPGRPAKQRALSTRRRLLDDHGVEHAVGDALEPRS